MLLETSASAMRWADSKDAALLNAVMLCVVVVMSVVMLVLVGVGYWRGEPPVDRLSSSSEMLGR
jgi:hypothetical protein